MTSATRFRDPSRHGRQEWRFAADLFGYTRFAKAPLERSDSQSRRPGGLSRIIAKIMGQGGIRD